MSDYKPGQLAKATVRGVRGVTIVRHDYRPGHNAYSVTFEWFDITTASWVLSVDVTDVRPLVVLDLGDVPFIGANNYPSWLRESAKVEDRCDGSKLNSRPKFLRWLADQIEEQTRPAIEEPKGLGAVVVDKHGKRWTLCEPGDPKPWLREDGEKWNDWSRICVTRVKSQGVTP